MNCTYRWVAGGSTASNTPASCPTRTRSTRRSSSLWSRRSTYSTRFASGSRLSVPQRPQLCPGALLPTSPGRLFRSVPLPRIFPASWRLHSVTSGTSFRPVFCRTVAVPLQLSGDSTDLGGSSINGTGLRRQRCESTIAFSWWTVVVFVVVVAVTVISLLSPSPYHMLSNRRVGKVGFWFSPDTDHSIRFRKWLRRLNHTYPLRFW